MLFVWLCHFFTNCSWARTLNRKKIDVQKISVQMRHCLHKEIEEIPAVLAWSTRASRRVTRQCLGGGGGGLTLLDYCFSGTAYKHLTEKGLPAPVIQLGVKSNPGSFKEALQVICYSPVRSLRCVSFRFRGTIFGVSHSRLLFWLVVQGFSLELVVARS